VGSESERAALRAKPAARVEAEAAPLPASCPMDYILRQLMGPWTTYILWVLRSQGPTRFGALKRRVPGVSAKVLTERLRMLEEAGVIQSRGAVLDPDKLNVGVTVFVSVRTNQHDLAWLEKFASAVRDFPEVVEFYRMSGDVDYLLRIVVPDIAAYDAVYKRLIARVALSDVSSAFAMETIKYTTALPLNYAP